MNFKILVTATIGLGLVLCAPTTPALIVSLEQNFNNYAQIPDDAYIERDTNLLSDQGYLLV